MARWGGTAVIGESRPRSWAAAVAFENERPAYDQVLAGGATLSAVSRLLRRHPSREFDAIHLAEDLWLQAQLREPLEFWVSDGRLRLLPQGST